MSNLALWPWDLICPFSEGAVIIKEDRRSKALSMLMLELEFDPADPSVLVNFVPISVPVRSLGVL